MGRLENGGGDQLARGASRVQFQPAGSKVTEDKWSDIFADFDAEAYKNAPNPAQVRSGDTNLPSTGDAGAVLGASEPDEPVTL